MAAALPGGDPLAAALAAGETPSPEMVAAAPMEGLLKPAIGIALLAVFVVTILLASWLTKYSFVYRLTPLNQSPEILRGRAREVIARLGYTDPAVDTADGIILRDNYFHYLEARDKSATRWERLRTETPGPYRFWYRQSPRYFISNSELAVDNPALDVVRDDQFVPRHGGTPALLRRGASATRDSEAQGTQADWSVAFREAGLDIAKFQTAASTWIPLHAYDERAAWDGVDPRRPDNKVHVEAASFQES